MYFKERESYARDTYVYHSKVCIAISLLLFHFIHCAYCLPRYVKLWKEVGTSKTSESFQGKTFAGQSSCNFNLKIRALDCKLHG